MLLFCPSCSNLLYVSRAETSSDYPDGRNAFACRTCPYQFLITTPVFDRSSMKKKEVEDIIGTEDAFKNADKIEVQCHREECDNAQAFYTQAQIRSADEPMTTFYRCTKCGTEWREN